VPPRTDADRELAGRILALVNAQAANRDQVSSNVRAAVRRALAGVTDWYDPRQVDAFVQAAVEAIRGGRKITAGVTEAYLRQQLDLLGVDPGRRSPTPADNPRGVPATEEWARPVKTYRYARLEGLDELEAAERAGRRAELMADTDLTLAMRDASRDLLAPLAKVRGWRRLVHPELSAGGTCGLCVVASDRLYKRAELLPIHDRCRCTVGPVVDGQTDPASWLNQDALAQLYEDAGGNTAAKLARTRYRINDHGELGPVLAEQGDDFRDAGDVAGDRSTPETPAEPAVDLRPVDTPERSTADSTPDLRALSDNELAALVSDPDVAADADRLTTVLAELDRRDDEERRRAEFDAAAALSEDEFNAQVAAERRKRNAGYDDEAEAAGLDPDEINPRRRGATSAQETRADWDLYLHEQMLAAEDATRGNLLSQAGKRAGATVYDLFTGDSVRAVRWASEELLSWWEEDERRRMSWPEWRSAASGTSSPAARRSRERFSKALQRWEDTRRGQKGRNR
jgi:hypothetical protein